MKIRDTSRVWGYIIFMVSSLCSQIGMAHEMRPSLLTLTSLTQGQVKVNFRIAFAKSKPMMLQVYLPKHCQTVSQTLTIDTPPKVIFFTHSITLPKLSSHLRAGWFTTT